MEKLLGNYSAYLYAIMRIVVGLLFACHGAQKLFGVFGGMGGSGEAAKLFSLIGVTGTIEFFAGVLIAVGFLTVYAAFLASGQMAVGYFMAHFPRGFWPILNGGELAVFYCFVFLYMAGRGTVTWGIDSVFKTRAGGP